MLSFYAVGDPHLEGIKKLFPNKDTVKIQLDHLAKIADHAIDNKITYIFLLGDIFDNPFPEKESVLKLLKLFKKYNNINWIAILGNHDFSNIQDTSLDVMEYIAHELKALPNVKILFRPYLEKIDGINLCFLPYPYHKREIKTRKPCIVFAHIDINGAKHNNNKVVSNAFNINLINTQGDYWVLGHIHSHQKIGKRTIYNGTSLQKNFGEEPNKGFVKYTAHYNKGKLIVKHKRIFIDLPYTLHNIQIKKPEDLHKLEKNSNKYYKIFVHEGVTLPPNIQEKYPILKIQGYKDKNFNLEKSTIDINKDLNVIFSPTKGLVKYLVNDYKMTKKNAKKAKKIVKNIVGNL